MNYVNYGISNIRISHIGFVVQNILVKSPWKSLEPYLLFKGVYCCTTSNRLQVLTIMRLDCLQKGKMVLRGRSSPIQTPKMISLDLINLTESSGCFHIR